MLKLTRQLYQWNPDAALFDYYERTLYNHVLSSQHPQTGMFAYMMPLMSGTARGWSTPYDDFWCCVGSGMESHAKHGDSIYWYDDERLYINLYIPSELNWKERGLGLVLDTRLPFQGEIRLGVQRADIDLPLTLALRIPAWAREVTLKLNGAAAPVKRDGGYALVTRTWQAGDTLTISMPLTLRFEPTQDDPATVAVLFGPLVLAADLGDAEAPWAGPAPALVGEELLETFQPLAEDAHFKVTAATPGPLKFVPFFAQYDRRNAVYFKQYDPVGWELELVRQEQQAAKVAALDVRSVDRVLLGDETSEVEHGL
jgi:DUF1680 family protein